MSLPFRAQAGSSGGPGSSGDTSFIGPEQGIDGVNGRAPGGPWPQDDLPMKSSPPSWSEGFSPSSDNPPLPSSHTDGVGLPPNGDRR